MVSKEVKIVNSMGLHLRPAGILADEALKFRCRISVIYREKTVNAKSLLGVLSLGIKEGISVTIECDGPDEEEALARLTEVINSGLGEAKEQ